LSASKSIIKHLPTYFLSILIILTTLFFACQIVGTVKSQQVTKSDLVVSFIDVWQGDAILIQTPNGKNILIDGGPVSHSGNLVRYLEDKKIRILHHVFATHLHPDHVGGLTSIIDRFGVEKLFDPGITYEHPDVAAYENARNGLEARYNLISKKKDIEISPNITLNILSPDNTGNRDIHTNCIVIYLEYKGISFLFTADMNYPAEDRLIEDKINLNSNVLKVSHHGENDACSNNFLDKVKPEYAVISVGEGNKYRRPKEQVLKRLENAGAKILRTDRNGTIVCRVSSEGLLTVTSER